MWWVGYPAAERSVASLVATMSLPSRLPGPQFVAGGYTDPLAEHDLGAQAGTSPDASAAAQPGVVSDRGLSLDHDALAEHDGVAELDLGADVGAGPQRAVFTDRDVVLDDRGVADRGAFADAHVLPANVTLMLTGTANLADGSYFEAADPIFVTGNTVPAAFRDGNSPGWAWNGTANQSSSTGPAP